MSAIISSDSTISTIPILSLTSPPNKRTGAEPIESIISKKVWFSDGNVVLVTGGVMFKVHRGQLARHSEVFQDIFDLAQPGNGIQYDGCDVIQLHDSPEELQYLLRALYDGL